MEYHFREIEKRWQDHWAKEKTFRTDNNSAKPKTIEAELPEILNGEDLKSTFNCTFVISKRKISITLPAFGADILL